MASYTKSELLELVLSGDPSVFGDKCAGFKDAVRAACKNVDKPVDDPEFPKECDDALDLLADCMSEYYG